MGLENYKNYYCYAEMVKGNEEKIIYVPRDISGITINDHIDGITNILKDGIETQFVHNCKITVDWGNGVNCRLSIIDYWYSLFMWDMVLKDGGQILPKHIFWNKELKRKNIKSFIDRFVASKNNKRTIPNKVLNNNICEGIWNYSKIEQFSYYLANTINNEDDIDLMNKCPEFYDLMHCSLANIPFDEVKDAGMIMTDRAIEIIKNSEPILGYEHALTNSFRASEAINPRQFKEVSLNIGTKPNGHGDVYPYLIDQSFKTGGVDTPLYYFIESSTARLAQIMSKTNVGESGNFARLLGLNNTDTILNLDPKYECLTNHFIKFTIKTSKHLAMIKNRYYRVNPNGIDYLIDDKDESLIGQTIYLRSPMTCSSNASGKGICSKCYGELYWTNSDINIGKIAAEILSAQLTQTLLSAKHLLETKIQKIIWNQEFNDLMEIDINAIKMNNDIGDLKNYYLIIDDVNAISDDDDEEYTYADEDDEGSIRMNEGETYSEYVTSFIIRTPDGREIECGSQATADKRDLLYLSNELNTAIRKKAVNEDNRIKVPLKDLADIVLFYIKINNNEISKTMDMIIHIINKSEVTKSNTKDEALGSIVDLVVEGNLTIDAIHLEIILSNQIVDANNPLIKPNWNLPSVQYKMCTLNEALTNNPSIVISLLYKDLHKALYNPLSFSKHGPSFFDLFYMEKPQVYINDELLVDSVNIRTNEKKIEMMRPIKEDK